MTGYQIRVLRERGELHARTVKLEHFLDTTKTIDPDERDRMERQLEMMQGYLDALDDRIEHF